MKIYQAIKRKKMLQSEISELWSRFANNNCVIKDNPRDYSPKNILEELDLKQNELVRLKIAMQKVNKPIYEIIFNLAELKSYASYIKNVNTRDGKHSQGYGGEIQEFESEFKKPDIDKMVADTQVEIGKLQDELDQFNFKTNIKW
jgi:hypothetical protein